MSQSQSARKRGRGVLEADDTNFSQTAQIAPKSAPALLPPLDAVSTITAPTLQTSMPPDGAKEGPSKSSTSSSTSVSAFLPPAYASLQRDFEALDSVISLFKKRGKLGLEDRKSVV